MRWFSLVITLCALFACPPGGHTAPVLLDGFEDASVWQARSDGGQSPRFSLEKSKVKEGQAALRLAYRNGSSGYGNLERAITLPAPEGALEMWIYKERSAPEAAMHVWLKEPDGDLWLLAVTEEGVPFSRWAPGWHRVLLPLSAFRFDGRGDKRQDRAKVSSIFLGCNFGDLDVVVDSLRFLPLAKPAAPAPETTLVQRRQIALGEQSPEVAAMVGAGWYEGEGASLGRWSGREGRPAEIRLDLAADREYLLTMQGILPIAKWHNNPGFSVSLDGRPLEGVESDAEKGTIRLRIPAASEKRSATLALHTGTFVPSRIGEGPDNRSLGLKVRTLEIFSYPRSAGGAVVNRGEKGSVAILRDDLPRSGTPSDPEHLGRVLRDAGYGVTFLKALDLTNPLCLNRANFDLLVLPYGASYPAEGHAALLEYLRSGGAFLSTGGYAFNNPVAYHDGRWVSRDTFLTTLDTGFVDVGASGDDVFLFGEWQGPESGHWEWGGRDGEVTKRWTGARAGIRLALDPAKAYTLRVSMAYRGMPSGPAQSSRLPNIRGRVLLNGKVLGAYEGAAGTAVLEFPVPAGAGRKDKASDLLFETQPWSPADILGSTDSRSLGIAVNWVKAIPEGASEAEVALPSSRFDVQFNTARGEAKDNLVLKPEQIGAFDPSYTLTDAVTAVPAPNQFVAPAGLRLQGPFEGFAAAGMFGSNSAVFPAGHARWIPILDAKDPDGRQRGALGALALHYAGPFRGSAWAFFGVTNRDLFAPGNDAMNRLLVATADALTRRAFLHGFRTEWSCYRAGEPVKARVTVRNAGNLPRRARVRFTIHGGPDALEVDAGEVAPGKTADVEAAWPSFAFTRDLYRVSATLLLDGAPADTMESGFVVWDPKVIAKGPRLEHRDNYFRVDGRPAFICGTNQTGMLFASTFENPFVWDRDLAQMSDNGVNVMRVLHFSPFAQGEKPTGGYSALDLRKRPEMLVRQTDALVQLCQKHHIALFLSLHDWMGVGLSDEELEAQRDWARFWADRYRDVPGIFYDVQNEPSADTPDHPDLRRAWNAFLQRRHGSDAALRAAWGTDAPAKPLGEIPLEPALRAPWNSVRAHDYLLFKADVLNRWVRANIEGVRAGNPKALCTVGYLQSLPPADKLLGARHVDFSNMHAYLSLTEFPRQFKWIDRRFDGKGLTLGEFGAKCHPAWNRGAFVGVSEAEGADFFLGIGHYTLGLGASQIANWSWKDMIDCVFPWGIVHPGDAVPKDVLPAYRNMSLFFRLFRPRYTEPGTYVLVPDSHRMGGSQNEVHRAALNAVQWLIDARVPFNVINEYDLDRLPKGARTLVWPVPYCPDDATYRRVMAFAQAGGTVLVTGDLSYDADRKRTRSARLEVLCGVRLADGAAKGEPDLRAPVAVTPIFARAVDEQQPTLYRRELGKGRVFYTPVPVEITAEGAALYTRFLRAAKVKAEPVIAPETVHAFRVDTVEPGGTWAYYNRGDRPATAVVSGVKVAMAPRKTGFVRVDTVGRPLAVEAQGDVTAAGKLIAQVRGHAMIAALDGLPLAQSRALLVLPVGAGRVSLPTSTGWKAPVIQAGEFRRGKWTALGTAAAPKGKGITVSVAKERRGDILLVCERAETARWSATLEKLLRFR